MTVSTCVRNGGEDIIAVSTIIMKDIDVNVFLSKYAQEPEDIRILSLNTQKWEHFHNSSSIVF